MPSDVIFRNYALDRKTVADYYRAADIFCHTTKADVCPLTVIEAQACGTPVLGTWIGGVPEILLDGKTGKLFGLGDAEELSSIIEKWIRSPNLIRKMGNDVAKYASEYFTIGRQAKLFLDLFYNALNNKKSEKHEY